MNYIAIINPASVKKILDGSKTIESRFCKNRYPSAWKTQEGDTLWIKAQGGNIVARTTAGNIHRYENLTPEKVWELESRFHSQVNGQQRNISYWESRQLHRYLVLVELKEIVSITIPSSVLPKTLPYASAYFSIPENLSNDIAQWFSIPQLINQNTSDLQPVLPLFATKTIQI